MFSALLNAQNRLGTIPITAVTWSIATNSTSTYTGSAQSVTVVSVFPPDATYSISTTTATNAGDVAFTTITGTGVYTGSFTSPTLTITKATITGTASTPTAVTYNAASQSGIVIINVLPGATFSGSTSASGTNAGTYTSSITGTGNYEGTVSGGNFVINKASLSVSGFAINDCGGFSVARMSFTVSGLQGADTGSLTTWIGTSSPTSIAPVSTNDAFFGNAVSQITGANPISVGNGTNTTSLYLCTSDSGFQYWVQVSGNATNYNTSGFAGPVLQDCGS